MPSSFSSTAAATSSQERCFVGTMTTGSNGSSGSSPVSSSVTPRPRGEHCGENRCEPVAAAWQARGMTTTRDPERVVRALVVAMFVHGIGASAVLPMLPLFLQQRHASDTMIGAVMASYFVAGVLTQYGAGHATDRLGHRR